jgi:CheY-like chemotaxis protein
VLTRARLAVRTAADGDEALEVLQHSAPDVFLLDLVLPRISGVELLERIALDHRRLLPRTVVLTAAAELAAELIPIEAIWAVVPKPVDIQLLVDTVYDCLLLQDADGITDEMMKTVRQCTDKSRSFR